MRRVSAFLFCALALCLLSFPGHARAAQPASVIEEAVRRGSLRVGFSSFVPWAMQDREGKYIGFEIDVAARLAADLGVELQLVPTNWDGIIPALLAGKFDVIIGSMAVTPERSLSVNFTVPYDTAFIDLTLNREKAGHVQALAELNKPEVVAAARTGTTAAAAARALLPAASLRLFNDEAPAVEEVLTGRAHAFFSSAPLPAMETLKHSDRLVQNFAFHAFSKPIAFAVRKGDLDTLNVFDGWIRVVEEEGWLQERRDYWFKSDEWESLLQ
jgi:polar amino acid transport system substrate-binding protein